MTNGIEQIDSDIAKVRQAFLDYLGQEPSGDQAAKVYDLVRFMIHADGKVTGDERLILDELRHLVVKSGADKEYAARAEYEVLVVPQLQKNVPAIAKLLGNASLEKRAGGEAYVAGTYFTRLFAEAVCRRYRDQHYFCTVESISAQDSIGATT